MKAKKIVILACDPSHPADFHEYEKTAQLFKVALEHSNVGGQVKVEYYAKGWPDDETTFETTDLIVAYTDGRDGDLSKDVPFVLDGRMQKMERWMKRGCGLMLIHFSTFFTREEGQRIMNWAGGYFEWEDEQGERNWYSRIDTGQRFQLSQEVHPITEGVSPDLYLNDEVYFQLRFGTGDERLIPIGCVPEFADEQNPLANVIAWAVEREDGGRGFGTTIGHAYRLWKDENYRRLTLNAIVWTVGLEVPAGGVRSRFYSDEELNQALIGVSGLERSHVVSEQIRVLLLSGNEHHKWHHWEETMPAIIEALEEDPRVKVDVILQANELAELDLARYDAIVLNYCNWHDPQGLLEKSKSNLLRYLDNSGGLAVLHFSNGSFHFSLPDAGASDWPEFRSIVPRVWNHQGSSGHDHYDFMDVQPLDTNHPIVAGIPPFTIKDELYFNQEGDAPVEVLCSAHSKVTGQEEPLVWLHTYKSARVFQSLLGHSAEAYAAPEARTLLRRGVLWAARRDY
ncbi:ThuA domain-containing protein [Paenibacillus eucommiae]|uniref:Type 1 glutamine amidotransferase n=1 Tax=Paenibacillus eucommiae TaxID=1355755 RepID=A0ABS4IX85_9BACL|nr:ThuA domain-containing protein [Paenibacillus eucommiae]MBP1992195.1 type 1 glutamine amidotransferase [Paenibacillus eucommiae]